MSISALSAVAKLIKYLYLFMLLLGFCNLLVMLSILCCCELCFLSSISRAEQLTSQPWPVEAYHCLSAGFRWLLPILARQALSCRSCPGQAAQSAM